MKLGDIVKPSEGNYKGIEGKIIRILSGNKIEVFFSIRKTGNGNSLPYKLEEVTFVRREYFYPDNITEVEKGDTVEIISGKFKGTEATVKNISRWKYHATVTFEIDPGNYFYCCYKINNLRFLK